MFYIPALSSLHLRSLVTKTRLMSNLWSTFTALMSKYYLRNLCPYANQSPSVFSIFAFILIKPSPKKMVFFPLYFLLILTKALPKRVFFSILALTLTIPKQCQKRCFPLFLPFSNQSPTLKGVFLYFCPYSNHCPATESV